VQIKRIFKKKIFLSFYDFRNKYLSTIFYESSIEKIVHDSRKSAQTIGMTLGMADKRRSKKYFPDGRLCPEPDFITSVQSI